MSGYIYRYALSPDLTIALEDSGNVVLTTPERTITVTNIEELRRQLDLCRELRDVAAQS